ncbi:hypothetical protein ACEPPN_011932 [Leptodophora sp. 'Broadleaf-Isolate-01']
MSTSSPPASEACKPTKALKNHPKGPLTFNDIGDLVTFIIGPVKTKVQIHKKIVCYYSPTLDAAFNGTFLEGSTQTYALESINESTFALFVEWIYSQKLENSPDKKLNATDLAAPRSCRTYITIDAIIDAYEHAAVDSSLRKIFVSHAAWSSPSELFDSYGSQLLKEFVLDIAMACRDIMSKRSIIYFKSKDWISRELVDYYVEEK